MHPFTTHVFQYYDLSILPMSKAAIRRCSIKKAVLRIFSKFTGNHLCQSFFFNKVAGPKGFIKKGALEQVCNFIKKRLWHSCFPMNFAKFWEHLSYRAPPWLLLHCSLIHFRLVYCISCRRHSICFAVQIKLVLLYKNGSFPLRIS